jgi:DNA-binding LacI/PurR family transcriptional regulator
VLDVVRNELGLKVPHDLSVVGFDDVGAARWPSFSLTTFSQPVDAMVDSVVDVITTLLDSNRPRPRRLRVAGELIVRGSVRRPPQCTEVTPDRTIWRP